MEYSYATVEAALAKVHQIDEGSMGAFRGRIQHLQKLGLVPAKPGKGKRVLYTNNDVFLWAICLELLELGIIPTVVKDFVQNYWYYEAFMWCFDPDEEEKGDKLLSFNLKKIRRLDEEEEKDLIRLLHAPDLGPAQLNHLGGRMVVLNISDLRRRLMDAIGSITGTQDVASQVTKTKLSAPQYAHELAEPDRPLAAGVRTVIKSRYPRPAARGMTEGSNVLQLTDPKYSRDRRAERKAG